MARHELMPGANAEDGDVQFEERRTVAQLATEADAGCTARQDQPVQLTQF